MSAPLPPADQIRAACAVIAALFERGQLGKANLAEALGFIVDCCGEIDGEPAVAAELTLPVMTLSQVAAAGRARPILHIVEGGRA